MSLAAQTQEVIDTIGNQEWLDPISDSVQQAIEDAFDAGGAVGHQIEDVLHGTKLIGHPLHPILTDIPVGAWTVAALLDGIEATTGNDEYAAGADAAVMLGFAGAIGAVLTGFTDWKGTRGSSRNVGIVHGILNSVATLLYGGSILARRRGARGTGRNLAFIGYIISMSAAALGGDLVYRQGIGVE